MSGVARSWFALTPDEHKAVLLVLALFLIGLAARYWHIRTATHELSPTIPAQSAAK